MYKSQSIGRSTAYTISLATSRGLLFYQQARHQMLIAALVLSLTNRLLHASIDMGRPSSILTMPYKRRHTEA